MYANRRAVSAVLLGVFMLLITGCDTVDSPRQGTCEVIAEDPLLRITEARDEASGERIPQLLITDVIRNGSQIPPRSLSIADGATLVDSTSLRCDVPCGLGRVEGRYVLTVQAEGYASTDVSLGQVEYAEREERGPCPAITFRGSEEVTVFLPKR